LNADSALGSGGTAKFVTGSTLRHVITMTAMASVGLISIFAVDALSLLYISMLGIQELAAAVGFASTLILFTLSFAVGLTVATSTLVSRALGTGDLEEAARVGGASIAFTALASTVLSAMAWPFLGNLVTILGARGETLELTTRFLQIAIPSTPIMALGMCATGILRAFGDGRRAMYVTLASGFAAAVFDPLLIFGFGLGLHGAAISMFLSRLVLLMVGFFCVRQIHALIRLPDPAGLVAAFKPFFVIGLPAALTQISTPIGNALITAELARFGDDAVAGWAIIGRIVPLAFSGMLALSGAVGPIFGQNFGARRYDRLQSTLRDSVVCITVYTIAIWVLLASFSGSIATLFGMWGEARDIVVFFCIFVAGSFLFNGAFFSAMAAFNSLGFPTYSTLFSWGRSTLGVLPFVWVGASLYGAKGVIAGWGLGAVLFGVAAIVTCFGVVRRLGEREPMSYPLDTFDHRIEAGARDAS
jgi:putative MATE family efflux protein